MNETIDFKLKKASCHLSYQDSVSFSKETSLEDFLSWVKDQQENNDAYNGVIIQFDKSDNCFGLTIYDDYVE